MGEESASDTRADVLLGLHTKEETIQGIEDIGNNKNHQGERDQGMKFSIAPSTNSWASLACSHLPMS